MAISHHNQYAATVFGTHAQSQTITCIILIIGYLWVRLAAENPAPKSGLSPHVMLRESVQRRFTACLGNQPYPASRLQQPEAGARIGAGPPTLQQALRLAFRLAAHTTVETGPQVKSRDALQQTPQFPSPEVLPVALQLALTVPVRIPVQIASGKAFRTTPGTVPGTVPRATREASFPATCRQTVLITSYETTSYEEGPEEDEDSLANRAFWCV